MTKPDTCHHIVLDSDLALQLQPAFHEDCQKGGEDVLPLLLPQLCDHKSKKQQQLQKVDHYMLLETQELYSRLQRYCGALGIDAEQDFKIAQDGQSLTVLGDFPNREALCSVLNRDLWFVDSFIWLQPNYALLAHSFEMLEFSEYYERAPRSAIAKYAHFEWADKGTLFALRFCRGEINAQVETPVNLYCV